jgi:ligand-binding sensor domain-containing protein
MMARPSETSKVQQVKRDVASKARHEPLLDLLVLNIWRYIYNDSTHIKKTTTKLNTLLFLSTLTLLTSCVGQTSTQNKNTEQSKEQPAKGDKVKELGSSIMVVYQDKKNIYWFGSWETGVYRYDGKIIINYTTKHGLPSNRVDEIKEDNSGNIYFNGCYPNSTISKFDGHKFTTLQAMPSNDWKLQSNDLWFRHSYQTEKAYRYDGITLHELQLPKPPKLSNPFEIYSIYHDRKGSVWFGTDPSGVCRYNGKLFEWIIEDDVTEFADGGANGVRSITEDGNGDFWFNTKFRYSVYDSVTLNSPNFYRRQESLGSLDGKRYGSLNEYLSILNDNNNNLWIGTYRNGVWRYDGAKVTHYPVQKGSQDITIFSVYKDNTDDLWLGTHENGAYKFNGTTFKKFTQ